MKKHAYHFLDPDVILKYLLINLQSFTLNLRLRCYLFYLCFYQTNLSKFLRGFKVDFVFAFDFTSPGWTWSDRHNFFGLPLDSFPWKSTSGLLRQSADGFALVKKSWVIFGSMNSDGDFGIATVADLSCFGLTQKMLFDIFGSCMASCRMI